MSLPKPFSVWRYRSPVNVKATGKYIVLTTATNTTNMDVVGTGVMVVYFPTANPREHRACPQEEFYERFVEDE
jgi:hypothetical protein